MGIRTTHVGSLPRPDSIATLLLAREHGDRADAASGGAQFDRAEFDRAEFDRAEFDRVEFDAAMAAAVDDLVRWQTAIGLDEVSDGEMSKISYSTYVKDRMTGFGGDTPRTPARDLAPYPELRQRLAAASGGAQSFQRQSCVGPIAYVGHDDLHADLAAMRRACDAHHADGFLNAASPGLVTAFQPNEHHPTHEEYVWAVAEAMRVEYEAIVAAGFRLQLDCPDLAMARHTGFQDLTDGEFLARARLHVDALNHATRDIDPAMMRMHLCWGNYEGPHDHDIPLDVILPIVLRARPRTLLFEAANVRHAHEWEAWREVDLPDDLVLAPGVIVSTSNYVEHPRRVAQLLQPYLDLVGAERVMASTDCGFGTFAGIGRVDPDVVGKKLRSLVEGAAIARS